jgi:hypothetical protein
MLTAYFSLKLSRLSLSTKEQKSRYNINPKLSQKKTGFLLEGKKRKFSGLMMRRISHVERKERFRLSRAF